MVLNIVKYGTKVLREKGARLDAVTPALRQLIGDMLDTMYAHKGVGLAAQQVGHALQLTVLDVRGVTDRPSTLEVDGQPADVAGFMPLVLINPQVKPVTGTASAKGPEGCLSFPEVYADVSRPESVDVTAQDKEGKPVAFRCGGLLSRAIQHEIDHLNGILFIDRMDKKTKEQVRDEIELIMAETKTALRA